MSEGFSRFDADCIQMLTCSLIDSESVRHVQGNGCFVFAVACMLEVAFELSRSRLKWTSPPRETSADRSFLVSVRALSIMRTTTTPTNRTCSLDLAHFEDGLKPAKVGSPSTHGPAAVVL